ncbi:hypothetical protein BLA29_007352 [Euroglyphus maynei]|uniref:Peptidase M13 N-terminal domain-containing protein n=1 Tax=Euroglyphus maynei TaxID=6958 RepID=A0A1Y3B7W8_EURMA|nr:hypothetical protein BLA29_007352 [Euroglyphus maynei]
MKRFYNSCMNVNELERKGAQPLIEIIKQLGGWPVLDVRFEENDTIRNNDNNTWNENDWSLLDVHRKLNELGVIDDILKNQVLA